jgi:hypothetical protein
VNTILTSRVYYPRRIRGWTRFGEPVRLRETAEPHWETRAMNTRVCVTLLALSWIVALAACSPKVQVQAPTEPITINLNVKIEHEIRVQVDRDLENLFDEDEDIF